MPHHIGLLAHLDLQHLPRKSPFVGGGPGKENFEQRIEPRARSRRSRDQKRTLTLRKELGVEQEERECAEMVAVQMRKHDAVDVIGIEAMRLERNQRRGSAIDKKRAFRRLDEKTRVEPTP